MSDQGIKSRPTYDTLRVDPTGLRHLLVSDSPDDAIEASPAADDAIEVWIVVPRGAEGRTVGFSDRRRCFRSPAHLIGRLAERLRHERMGLRLYASGTETFLWDVHGAAQRAGMSKQEVFLAQTGSHARRVQCVHCKTFNEGVTTTIVRCDGCGANLFVRDHFSRRLAAFMGVKADAEVPGDVPPAEQAYP
ncbi:MAG: dimethylamine monooxygenase subunit DmmA family protein [Methylorubrum populi]